MASMEVKLAVVGFLNEFEIARTATPLRMTVNFLYEPADDRLVQLSPGGLQLPQK